MEEFTMTYEILIRIRQWEEERDRCLSIHCTRVAAKYQKWIDNAMMEMGEQGKEQNATKRGLDGTESKSK